MSTAIAQEEAAEAMAEGRVAADGTVIPPGMTAAEAAALGSSGIGMGMGGFGSVGGSGARAARAMSGGFGGYGGGYGFGNSRGPFARGNSVVSVGNISGYSAAAQRDIIALRENDANLRSTVDELKSRLRRLKKDDQLSRSKVAQANKAQRQEINDLKSKLARVGLC